MGLKRKKILTNMIMYQHTYTVTLYKLTAKRVSNGHHAWVTQGFICGGSTNRWLLCIALV